MKIATKAMPIRTLAAAEPMPDHGAIGIDVANAARRILDDQDLHDTSKGDRILMMAQRVLSAVRTIQVGHRKLAQALYED